MPSSWLGDGRCTSGTPMEARQHLAAAPRPSSRVATSNQTLGRAPWVDPRPPGVDLFFPRNASRKPSEKTGFTSYGQGRPHPLPRAPRGALLCTRQALCGCNSVCNGRVCVTAAAACVFSHRAKAIVIL